MIDEFKKFVMRGNVLDLAVGVIIGGAFGKIVSSLVDDMIMPLIGKATGGIDFTNMFIPLSDKIKDTANLADAKKLGAVFAYGSFIQNVVNFVIIAFCIFILVKIANSMQKKEPEAAAAPSTKDCPQCLMSIPIAAKKCGHCTSAL
jgi:large conductance mechanosensitive channel